MASLRKKKGKFTFVLSARRGMVHVSPGITKVTVEFDSDKLLRALNNVPVAASTHKQDLAKAKARAKARAAAAGN